jgi:hypothetical protein
VIQNVFVMNSVNHLLVCHWSIGSWRGISYIWKIIL